LYMPFTCWLPGESIDDGLLTGMGKKGARYLERRLAH
jgi:hypothetical protein